MTTKEYIPEVGEVCECQSLSERWVAAEIMVAVGASRICMVRSTSQIFWSTGFRPAKTQQEIEREKQIAELNKFISDWQRSPEPVDALGELLWYAGYHNGVKVGDEIVYDDLADFMYVTDESDEVVNVRAMLSKFRIYPRGE